MSKKPLVDIYMGSDSDLKTMSLTAEYLDKFDIDYNMYILSAHRTTDEALKTVKSSEKRGVDIIIAGAGKAAHLPGVLASKTSIPVIGVPMKTSDLGGRDSLYSIVQMPTGIPVATVAIGKTGAKNSAVLAAKILSIKYESVKEKVEEYMENMAENVLKKNKRLQEKGYKNY